MRQTCLCSPVLSGSRIVFWQNAGGDPLRQTEMPCRFLGRCRLICGSGALMNTIKMPAAMLLAVTLLAGFAATAAFAESRAQFCSRMNTICVDTCPPGFACQNCPAKLAACQKNGCFEFIRTPKRCENEEVVPTCSEMRRRCLMQGGNENGCTSAHASCMRTGQWISLRGKNLGPARRE